MFIILYTILIVSWVFCAEHSPPSLNEEAIPANVPPFEEAHISSSLHTVLADQEAPISDIFTTTVVPIDYHVGPDGVP